MKMAAQRRGSDIAATWQRQGGGNSLAARWQRYGSGSSTAATAAVWQQLVDRPTEGHIRWWPARLSAGVAAGAYGRRLLSASGAAGAIM